MRVWLGKVEKHGIGLAGQKQTNQLIYINLCNHKVGMIQAAKPKYRIKYNDCNIKNHEGEKLNFVCLNQQCCDSSLICSLCREDRHKGHSIQPLKFYIEALKQQYETERVDYSKQFEALETSRCMFLIKLRQCVEKVADEFMKLEQEIIERYEQLKNQIIQNQSRKNKFSEFYQSLAKETEDHPEFLIRNYLPSKQVQPMENVDCLDQLTKKLSTYLYETRESLFTGEGKKQQIVQTNLKFQEKLANTVTHIGNIFAQTSTTPTAINYQSLSAIASDLIKNFQNTKIKIKITKLKKNSAIHIGAIEKQFFKTLANKAPTNWINPANNGKLYFFNNQALTFGQTVSQLKTFAEGSNIQITMTGNTMKIGMKKFSAEFNLVSTNEFYFFFNLVGQADIEVTFVKK